MSTPKPNRGEIWLIDLGEPIGHEQGYTRPALVISVDQFNHGPAELAIVLPITGKEKGVHSHVPVGPSEGGLRERSFIKCEDIRSVSTTGRFIRRWGAVGDGRMREVERILRLLLNL